MSIQRDPEGTETRHLHEHIPLDGKRVLEIGCGDGRLTWRYATSVSNVTGIDPDMEALQAALASRPPELRHAVSFLRASALDLPHPSNTFDLAILAWSL